MPQAGHFRLPGPPSPPYPCRLQASSVVLSVSYALSHAQLLMHLASNRCAACSSSSARRRPHRIWADFGDARRKHSRLFLATRFLRLRHQALHSRPCVQPLCKAPWSPETGAHSSGFSRGLLCSQLPTCPQQRSLLTPLISRDWAYEPGTSSSRICLRSSALATSRRTIKTRTNEGAGDNAVSERCPDSSMGFRATMRAQGSKSL